MIFQSLGHPTQSNPFPFGPRSPIKAYHCSSNRKSKHPGPSLNHPIQRSIAAVSLSLSKSKLFVWHACDADQ